MPSGHKTRDVPSRYQPLVDLLATCEQEEIVLTFKAIAALIGGPLPEGAILGSGWWTRRTRQPVARWRAMGWRARAERDHLRVIFTRDAEEGRG